MLDSSHIRRICLLYCLLAWAGVLIVAQPAEQFVSAANCENFLYIIGESNINQFSFRYNRSDIPGKRYSVLPDTANFEISIPIREFQPSNPMMYSDFLNMLKESEYPEIKVTFSKRQLQRPRWSLPGNCHEMNITIAGITRTYKVQCSVNRCSDNLYLSGEKSIMLSDFKLKPPERMLGLVKVNNEINVNFGFIITFTDVNPIAAKL
jgi:hypothetical protein